MEDRKDEKRKQRGAVKEGKEEQIKNANEQVKKAEVKAQKAAGKTGCEEKGR